jgi:hypothetical protein
VHGWLTQADLTRATTTWLLSLALRKRARMLNGSGLFDRNKLDTRQQSYVIHPSFSCDLCFVCHDLSFVMLFVFCVML